MNERILALPEKSRVDAVIKRICDLIGDKSPIDDREIKTYVSRVLESFDVEQLRDCLDRDLTYKKRIEQQIDRLSNEHKEKAFNEYVTTGKIFLKPSYKLPDFNTPVKVAMGLPKTLYQHEAEMNPFEKRVINDIANLDSVAFWTRNPSKGDGFRINGFINHYPDFLVFMKSGKIVVVETKGDFLDNWQSQARIRLGQKWASESGKNYNYFMIFETREVSNAYNASSALNLISQL